MNIANILQVPRSLSLSIRLFALFSFVALPWLNPFAPGPTPAVMPLLFSWACAAALLLVCCGALSQAQHSISITVVARAWLAAGIVSSGIAMCQYLGAGDSLLPWVNQTRPGEAFANLRQRNQFASLTNIALAALVCLTLQCIGKSEERKRTVIVVVFGTMAAVLLGIGTAASTSRTGFLQLLVLMVLSAQWRRLAVPSVRRILLAALFAYAIATFALPWLAGFSLPGHGMFARLRGSDPACTSRITLWSNVLTLIAQKPWFGWGWGELDYAHYITLYEGPRFCDILDNAHNLPLHLAVELGIPFSLLICGAATWWVCRQKPWNESDPTRQLAWSVLAIIGLHSLLEYPLWYGPFQMATGLCLLILWKRSIPSLSLNKPYASGLTARLTQVGRPFLGALFIGCCIYAAWDYHRISQIYLLPEERDEAYRYKTLDKIRDSRLFADQVLFAELSLTPLSRANAQWTYDNATALLHYSPEPRIIEKLIESAVMLNHDDEALLHLARYRLAFPNEYAKWRSLNQKFSIPTTQN